jgi:hypothetical protein
MTNDSLLLHDGTGSAAGNNNITAFLTAISIVGTIGNLIVAFVYFQKRDKQTATFFIKMLAFIDLSVCSILVPMTIYMERIFFETSSAFICKSFFFLTTTTVPMSSLLMTAIAFDRYFCICMVGRNIMTLSKARVIAVILLIVSALLGVIPALAAVTKIHNNNETTSLVISTSTSSSEELAYSNGSYLSSVPVNSADYLCGMDLESEVSPFGVFIRPFKYGYDFVFIASVITITVLYVLIYKEIYTRRKVRRDKKHKLMYSSFINGGKRTVKDRENGDAANNREHTNSEPDASRSLFSRIFFCCEFLRIDEQNGKFDQ